MNDIGMHVLYAYEKIGQTRPADGRQKETYSGIFTTTYQSYFTY